jgi:hypothetical protein
MGLLGDSAFSIFVAAFGRLIRLQELLVHNIRTCGIAKETRVAVILAPKKCLLIRILGRT